MATGVKKVPKLLKIIEKPSKMK